MTERKGEVPTKQKLKKVEAEHEKNHDHGSNRDHRNRIRYRNSQCG